MHHLIYNIFVYNNILSQCDDIVHKMYVRTEQSFVWNYTLEYVKYISVSIKLQMYKGNTTYVNFIIMLTWQVTCAYYGLHCFVGKKI